MAGFSQKIFIHCLTIIVAALPITGVAQQTRFEHLTLEDGLSQSTVNTILRDSRGFMWFGTGNGLNKFDGYDFTVYHHEPNDTSSLSDDWITAICEDRQGALWIGTDGGLNKFDPHTGKCVRIKSIAENPNSLSHHYINAIYEDHSGTLWVGTAFGLNRMLVDSTMFSGAIRFHRYFANPNSKVGLSNNNIQSICEDRQGNLWVATYSGGLNRFNPERSSVDHFFRSDSVLMTTYPDETWHRFRELAETRQPIAEISQVANSQDLEMNFKIQESVPVLIVSAGEGFEQMYDYAWLEREGEIIWKMELGKTRHAGGALKNRMAAEVLTLKPGDYQLRYQSDDSHCYGAWNRLPPHDPEQWGSRIFPLSAPEVNFFTSVLPTKVLPSMPSSNTMTNLYIDDSGYVWIGTNRGGLNRFDPRAETFSYYLYEPENPESIAGPHIRDIEPGPDGTLWVGTTSGLSLLDVASGTAKTFRHSSEDPSSISSNDIAALNLDHTGTLWIGSVLGGIDKFNRLKNRFRKYTHDPRTATGRRNRLIYTFYEDNSGFIWIGGRPGLNLFEPRNEGFLDLEIAPAMRGPYAIMDIHKDRSGRIWAATNNDGLFEFEVRLHEDSAKLELVSHYTASNQPNSISTNLLWTIYEDEDGTLWIGTQNGGLSRFDPETKLFTRYIQGSSENGISNNSVRVICPERSDRFWLGTGGGLNLFDKKTQSFTHYKNDPNDPNSLSHNDVTSIYEDDDGNLWLSTYGGGINKFVLNAEHPYFVRYTEENGLPNNVIYGILADAHGNLWMSSNKGLSKFDPRTERFKNYDFNDGLQSNEFNTGAYLKTDSGEMYFGGINGFNVFHPDSIRDNPNIPPIAITSFKVFDETIDNAARNRLVELTHAQNFVSFEFVALDYTNSQQNQYAYKLEGLHRDWVYCGTRRYGSYANLPPGDYTLRVKGSNSDGVWNDAGAVLRFVISPPWWQRAWFKVFAVLLVGGLIYAGYRLRMQALASQKRKLEKTVHEKTAELRSQKRLIEEQAEKLSELDRLKSRFFTNISHEFRTPLTLILTPLEQMLANGYDHKTKAVFSTMRRNARRLLQLINQLLELAKIENDQMEMSLVPGDLVAFMRGTVASFESLAEQKYIALSFRCELAYLPCRLDYDKMEKIVYNLLSNALKFTPQSGSVSVTLALKSEMSTSANGGLKPAPASASRQDDWSDAVLISVKDNGKGMTPEQCAHVFDRFYQNDDSDTRAYEGTGIGLALTKELVEAHDGTISVKSDSGKGSEFLITLPLHPAKLAECKPARLNNLKQGDTISFESDTEQPAAAHDEKRALILVVEDNPDMRSYIKSKLASEYRIVTAVNGAKGITKAKDILPDLVISDVMMPGADGFELCRNLKTDEKSSHIPIILLTAKASDKNKLEGLQIGADDYLIKPFDLNQLRVRINNLITQRRRLRQRFRREMILEPEEIAVTPVDEAFLKKVAQHIEDHLADDRFGAEELNSWFNMSRSQFYRKIRALTGTSPIQLIRTMRLKRAKQLLEQQGGTVSEIAFQVGFNNLSYFSKSFREVFGHLPSEHQAS